ncbi:aspartyl/asparaginyl beta-hydroxylase domain-containing protein [Microbispora triticiradicis]|uniref:Aspartyl/asparaginyl beta-hydroxylase domain-containing protein n=2 Tax=Microbispora TaxID=2005 RepID=A0ABY3M306_9ACTN|nr:MULTISPECIES: aspartyl/asparaginyl beta-hydroxylase domain-containing protein [Microbispora]TLP54037.1 aspartyl/asparaginyl beta-hydroxylase domain-containing protein [Microbispora fusca]TYB65108.1 aspartyl/asparaginyl beta-hydroxylase domain-containing protein [Microbispora tritici]
MSVTHQQVLEPIVCGHPAAARLLPTFDVARLLEDLDRLDDHQWSLQQTFTSAGLAERAPYDWRALPLRSPTGRPERTDPGGAGLDEFADTPWLAQAPYFAEILASVPAPLRCVRLLALGPGAIGEVHFDTKVGFPWGNLRLHVPITTNPGAALIIEGVEHRWQPGTFWFGDFGRWHQVLNTGQDKRIHMIIDTLITPETLSLFPPDFLETLSADEVLYARPTAPLDDPERYHCAFEIPASFADWEEAEGQFLLPQPKLAATVNSDDDGNRLVLTLDGEPTFGLVHVGEGEFRFTGWTEERTIQVVPDGAAPTVILRTRRGTAERRLEIPATRRIPSAA